MEYLAPDYPQKDSRDDSMLMCLGLLDLFAINPAAFFLSFFLSIFFILNVSLIIGLGRRILVFLLK